MSWIIWNYQAVAFPHPKYLEVFLLCLLRNSTLGLEKTHSSFLIYFSSCFFHPPREFLYFYLFLNKIFWPSLKPVSIDSKTAAKSVTNDASFAKRRQTWRRLPNARLWNTSRILKDRTHTLKLANGCTLISQSRLSWILLFWIECSREQIKKNVLKQPKQSQNRISDIRT